MKDKLNEKIIDDMIEAAMDRYAESIAEEDSAKTLTAEQERHCEESKEEIRQKVLHQLKKEQKKHSRRCRRVVRRSLICAAALTALAVMMVNVSAVRVFVYKTYANVKGTVLSMQPTSALVDYTCIEDFQNKDELIIPSWLPPGTVVEEITDTDLCVTIRYVNEMENLKLRISEQKISESLDTAFETENNEYIVEECKVMGMDGKIIWMQSEVDTKRRTVVWSSDTTYYELSTTADDILFETIMSGLKYYKEN